MTATWIIQLIIVLLAAYGGYAVAVGVNNRQPVWALFGIAALVAAWGLLRDRPWSQYIVYLIAAMVPISWVFVVWHLTVSGWPYGDATSTVISLVPGGLAIILCVGVILAVFRHFHPAKPR